MTLVKMLHELQDKLLAEFNKCQEAQDNLSEDEFDENAHYLLEERLRELDSYMDSIYNILAYLNEIE